MLGIVPEGTVKFGDDFGCRPFLGAKDRRGSLVAAEWIVNIAGYDDLALQEARVE